MDTATLIREARKHSAAAQKCLFDLYAERMMLVCCRYLKRKEDAEERVLDGFLNFFKHLDAFKYQGEAALYAWLKKIMINECLMFLRKKNLFQLVAETEAAEIEIQDESFDQLSANEIFSLILQLPVGYRTVFNLFVLEGMPHNEIAQSLGINEGTSRSQLSKARQLLQKMYLQLHRDIPKQNNL